MKKVNKYRNTSLVFLFAALIVMSIAGCAETDSSSSGSNSSAQDSGFTEKINSCGQCGTDSPIGGWEAADGKAIILNADDSAMIVFGDGETGRATWEISGGQLCLDPGVGDPFCYKYEQKKDVMRLDGTAIYERR